MLSNKEEEGEVRWLWHVWECESVHLVVCEYIEHVYIFDWFFLTAFEFL